MRIRRTDEILTFANNKKIAPLSLYAILKEIHSIKRFQLVQKQADLLELRLVSDSKNAAFVEAKSVLMQYLSSNNIQCDIILSESEPLPHPKSGKFKHIIGMPNH